MGFVGSNLDAGGIFVLKKIVPPSFNANYTYNASVITPVFQGYDSDKMLMWGDTTGVNAGVYTVYFVPKEMYCWADSGNEVRAVQWEIKRQVISSLPVQSNNLTYNGNQLTPAWNNYVAAKMTTSGELNGVSAGSYEAIFTPTDNYMWWDETIEGKAAKWIIKGTPITVPTQSGRLTYNGGNQIPEWTNYDTYKMTLTECKPQTNAGEYSAFFVPKNNYGWSDGTVEPKEVLWYINRAAVPLPTQVQIPSYDGEEHIPEWEDFDENKLTVTVTPQTDAGEYIAKFVPTDNYCWSDNTYGEKSVTWTIKKVIVSLPVQKGIVQYDGDEHLPEWEDYDEDKLSLADTELITSSNIDAYFDVVNRGARYFEDTDNIGKFQTYARNSESEIVLTPLYDSLPLSVSYSYSTFYTEYSGSFYGYINSGYFFYVGGTKSYYDSKKLVLTKNDKLRFYVTSSYGNNSTNVSFYDMYVPAHYERSYVGTHYIYFTPNKNYMWADGTTDKKGAEWVIGGTAKIQKIPVQSGTLVYTGGTLTPAWDNYDSKVSSISVVSQINAGEYSASVSPKEGYIWSDDIVSEYNLQNANDPVPIKWKIDRAVITNKPTTTSAYTYTGNTITPTWNNYNANQMTIGGVTSALGVGTYTTSFSVKDNYKWADVGTEDIEVVWRINPIYISTTPSQSNILRYTGAYLTPSFSSYDVNALEITAGEIEITPVNIANFFTVVNAEYYFAADGLSFTSNNGGIKNSTAETKLKTRLNYSLVSFDYSYSSEENYDKFTLKVDNEVIEDNVSGSTTKKHYESELVPNKTIEFKYSKDNSNDSNNDRCSFYNMYVIPAEVPKIEVGEYTARFTPKPNYAWSGGTTEPRDVIWKILGQQITVEPSVNANVLYTGDLVSPQWNNFDESKLDIGGTTSAAAVGSYYAEFVPKPNYCWTDNTRTGKLKSWFIVGTMIPFVPSQSGTLIYTGEEIAPEWIDYNASQLDISGETSASSAGIHYAEFTPKPGYYWEGGSRETKRVAWEIIALPFVPKNFSECTDDEMAAMIEGHYNDLIDITDYWNVGDTRTIYFSGTNATSDITTAHPACNIQIRIIGFGHDTLLDPIHGHTKAAVTLEFVNSLTNACYVWGKPRNGAASVSGGLQNVDVWSNNPRRSWLNGDFKQALPLSIRNSIKTVVKTTKNTHTVASRETTNDDVFLLSVYEVYKDTDINYSKTTNKIAEGSQYKFYETANNRTISDYYVGTTVRANRWLRSPALYYYSANGYAWSIVGSETAATIAYSGDTYAHGIAPAFCL